MSTTHAAPLRLAGSTFSFMWQGSALSALRTLQELGLDDFDVITVPGHLWPGELSQAARATLAAQLRAEGIRLDSLNLPALDHNLASCIPEVRAAAVAAYGELLRLSADLGARAVVVVPGRVSTLWPPPQQDAVGRLGDSIGELLRIAAPLGQVVLIESHPQTPIPTADDIAAFLDGFEDPRLQVAYDVANAEFVGEDQPSALRRLAPRLGQVHLSDGTRTRWRHDRIGLGTVDFRAIDTTLRQIGFAGVAVLEIISNEPVPDVEASLRALRDGGRAA